MRMCVEEHDPALLPVPDPDTGVPGAGHNELLVHVNAPHMVIMPPQCHHLQDGIINHSCINVPQTYLD